MQPTKQLPALKTMNICLLAFAAITLLFSCTKNGELSAPENAEPSLQNSFTSKTSNGVVAVPYEILVYVPCGNGGAGENVTLTGMANFVYQMIWTDHGFTLVYHDNFNHLTGSGALSGEAFAGSGGTNGTVTGAFENSLWTGTTTRSLRIAGTNTRFTLKYKSHITVAADGTVKVDNDETTADCK